MCFSNLFIYPIDAIVINNFQSKIPSHTQIIGKILSFFFIIIRVYNDTHKDYIHSAINENSLWIIIINIC